MREGSSDQVKDGQGSFLTMGSFGFDGSGKGFKFEVSRDGLGGEVSQDFEGESEDIEEAETRLEKLIIDGSFGLVGLRCAKMAVVRLYCVRANLARGEGTMVGPVSHSQIAPMSSGTMKRLLLAKFSW